MLTRCLLTLCLLTTVVRGDALVTAVKPGSAAQRAGLRPGDILLRADGVPISRALNLKYAAARARDSGRRQLALTIVRRGAQLRLRLPLDLDGISLLPYDPPDRLRISLEIYGRTRDQARLRAEVARYLDWAPGVGDQLLTASIQASDPALVKSRQALAAVLAREIATQQAQLAESPRRRRIRAELSRLRRRLAQVSKWTDPERKLCIYAMRFQKAGLNFYLARNLGPVSANWNKSLELYLKIHDWDNAVNVLANLGLLHQRHGAVSRALPYYHRAWLLVESRGLTLEKPRLAHLLGVALTRLGKAERATVALRAGLAVARRLGLLQRQRTLLESLVLPEWQARRPGRAEASFEAALALAQDAASRTRLLQLGAGLARDTGRQQLAIARLVQALKLAAASRRQSVLGQLATAYLDARQLRRAAATIEQLEASLLQRARYHKLRARSGQRPWQAWSDHLRSVGLLARAGEWKHAGRWLVDVPPLPLSSWRRQR